MGRWEEEASSAGKKKCGRVGQGSFPSFAVNYTPVIEALADAEGACCQCSAAVSAPTLLLLPARHASSTSSATLLYRTFVTFYISDHIYNISDHNTSSVSCIESLRVGADRRACTHGGLGQHVAAQTERTCSTGGGLLQCHLERACSRWASATACGCAPMASARS